MIGSIKERKQQMRAVGVTQVKSNNFTTTVCNEPSKVAAVGRGFGQQRPISRDSRVKYQPIKQ